METDKDQPFSHFLLAALLVAKGYNENLKGKWLGLTDLYDCLTALEKAGIATKRFDRHDFECFLAECEIQNRLYQTSSSILFRPSMLNIAFNAISARLQKHPELRDDLEIASEVLNLERLLFCHMPSAHVPRET